MCSRFECPHCKLPVLMCRHHFPKLKIVSPSTVLVPSDVSPSNHLTFLQHSSLTGFLILFYIWQLYKKQEGVFGSIEFQN